MAKPKTKKPAKPTPEQLREMREHFRAQTAFGLQHALEIALEVFNDKTPSTVFEIFDLIDFDEDGNAPSDGALAQLALNLKRAKEMAVVIFGESTVIETLGVYERAFADFDDDDEDEDEEENE